MTKEKNTDEGPGPMCRVSDNQYNFPLTNKRINYNKLYLLTKRNNEVAIRKWIIF